MNGLAVTIVVGQLPKLFGFSTDADGFVDEIREFVEHLDRTEGAALAVGAGALVVLLLLPRITRRIPAVLVAVAGATIVSAALGLADHGVATVGSLPSGVPSPSFPWTSVDDVGPLLLAAIGIVLVSLTDTIATASAFAARRGDELEPNQEMIGIGAANVAAGFFQGFAISTSGSRTAVAEQSGAKSQVTNLVGAGLVVDPAGVPQLAPRRSPAVGPRGRGDRRGAVPRQPARPPSVRARAGLVAGALPRREHRGHRAGRPRGHRRRDLPRGAPLLPPQLVAARCRPGDVRRRSRVGTTSSNCPAATEVPGVLVYRWEAPLFFANAGAFRQQVRRLVRERDPQWIVLQCEAITDIDVTAAEMLEQLDVELNAAGRHLAFVELRSRLQDLVQRYGLFETLDRDHFYPSIETALRSIDERDA